VYSALVLDAGTFQDHTDHASWVARSHVGIVRDDETH